MRRRGTGHGLDRNPTPSWLGVGWCRLPLRRWERRRGGSGRGGHLQGNLIHTRWPVTATVDTWLFRRLNVGGVRPRRGAPCVLQLGHRLLASRLTHGGTPFLILSYLALRRRGPVCGQQCY